MKFEMIYICDKCGLEFRDEEECKYHEQNKHIEIDILNLRELEVRYTETNTYPEHLFVPMKDGSIVAYSFSHLYQSPPTEKEKALETEDN